MNSNGGKNFLRTCLNKIDSSMDIDRIFCYKYANHAAEYQHDEYTASLTTAQMKDITDGVPYVVACFTHLEFFVAWHQSVGRGNGKYSISKHDLIAFENDLASDYVEHIIGIAGDAKVYIFRNESGFNKFYKDVVAPSLTT